MMSWVIRSPVLLADHDVAGEVGDSGYLPEHLVQQVGGADRVGRRLLEEVEELPVLGGEDLCESGHVRPAMVDVKAA